jgi:hypothetical protein
MRRIVPIADRLSPLQARERLIAALGAFGFLPILSLTTYLAWVLASVAWNVFAAG